MENLALLTGGLGANANSAGRRVGIERSTNVEGSLRGLLDQHIVLPDVNPFPTYRFCNRGSGKEGEWPSRPLIAMVGSKLRMPRCVNMLSHSVRIAP